jgi:hypothetical protein
MKLRIFLDKISIIVLQLLLQVQQLRRRFIQMPKRRKVGRPKLPKSEAKGRIVPVRFTAEALKAIAAKARERDETVSEWIRNTLNAAINEESIDANTRT